MPNHKERISLVGEGKELDINTFSEYLVNYADDVVKKASKSFSESNVKNILNRVKDLNKKANNGRRLLNIAAMIVTAAFSCAVPVFYKRNKSFPGTEGLRGDQSPVNKEAES